MEEKSYKRKQRNYYAMVIFKATLVSILFGLLYDISYLVWPILIGDVFYTNWFFEVNYIIIVDLITVPLLCLLLRKNVKETKEMQLPGVKLSFVQIVGFICIVIFAEKIGSYIGSRVELLISLLAPANTSDFTANPEFFEEEENVFELLFSLVSTAVLTPIFEEIMWRKTVLNGASRYGLGPAILLSGIAFGLWHGNFAQAFGCMLCGLVFAFVYAYTRKLIYPIILHMSINGLASLVAVNDIVLSKCMQRNEFEELPDELFSYQLPMMIKQYPLMTFSHFFGESLYLLDYLIVLAGAVFLVFFIIKFCKLRKTMMLGSAGATVRAFANWGMIVFAVYVIYELLMAYLPLFMNV